MRDRWAQEIEAWAQAARGAGHYDGTIRLRTHYLKHFATHTGTAPYDATPDTVSDWLAHPGWKAETRASARSSLHVFYRWAVRTGRATIDPTLATDPVRVPRGMPRPAPEAVLTAALLRATPSVRLMLLLAAYGGLRRAEVAGLHAGDVIEGRMRITGKGGRVRWVPMHDRVAEAFAAHVAGRGYDGFVFPGRDGGHLSPDRVGRLMSDALGPGWTAHTLRHRFGTKVYAGTRDLLQTQTLLGHSSPVLTQRYVAVPDDDMAAAVNAIA